MNDEQKKDSSCLSFIVHRSSFIISSIEEALMVDGNGAHPSPDRLVAFAQGRLGEDELVAMSRHLQRCLGCLSAAESMPGDFFAATLRKHAPRPVQPAVGADTGRPAAPVPPAPAP